MSFRLWRLTGALVLASLGAGLLFGQQPKTTIQDTLYKADGTRFNGVAFIEWKSFYSGVSKAVATHSTTGQIVDGVLNVQLIPTTDATPQSYYSVTFNSDGRIQFREFWAVPPSAAPLKLKDIRLAAQPLPGEKQLGIADIALLQAELAVRPVRGSLWQNQRVVMAGSSGDLNSVAGGPTDCVRVNGTAVPCEGGSGAPSIDYVDGEIPQGAIDGSNATFNLANAPDPGAGLMLYRNGLLQKQGLDYTLSGSVVTFTGPSVPVGGDLLLAFYRLSGSDGIHQDAETPSGVVDGSNLTFTLYNAPTPEGSLQLFRNGLLQKQGIDYTLSERTVTFFGVAVPQPGDILLAFYRKAR
jgi:hypothetical protein